VTPRRREHGAGPRLGDADRDRRYKALARGRESGWDARRARAAAQSPVWAKSVASVTAALPEVAREHYDLADGMYREAVAGGWYIGDYASLMRARAWRTLPAVTEPELQLVLQLTRDRMHHSVGWWRNAEYEYCWHLSMSVRDRLAWAAYIAKGSLASRDDAPPVEEFPAAERRYWALAVFREEQSKLWVEPGGTDPRLTRQEALDRAKLLHLRLFLDPETLQPFMPRGEVYDLTRWIDGLTPEKVDR
jgi:hypothetical protein